MTAIPDLFNRYGFHLVPGFWQTCYPLMFFFIGSYVKEYQPKINPLYGWGIIIICCLINPVFNILFVHNRPLIHIAGNPSGMFGTIIAVIFFLLVYQRDIQVPLMRKIFTKVSLLSLSSPHGSDSSLRKGFIVGSVSARVHYLISHVPIGYC